MKDFQVIRDKERVMTVTRMETACHRLHLEDAQLDRDLLTTESQLQMEWHGHLLDLPMTHFGTCHDHIYLTTMMCWGIELFPVRSHCPGFCQKLKEDRGPVAAHDPRRGRGRGPGFDHPRGREGPVMVDVERDGLHAHVDVRVHLRVVFCPNCKHRAGMSQPDLVPDGVWLPLHVLDLPITVVHGLIRAPALGLAGFGAWTRLGSCYACRKGN